MKRLIIAAAAVAALSLSPGAQAAGVIMGKYRGKIPSGFLKGTWTINFYKGGYKVTGPFGSLTGRSTFKGSTVVFSHESEGTICPGAGTYRFKITGKTLKMTSINEPCRPRRLVHTVPTYKRIG